MKIVRTKLLDFPSGDGNIGDELLWSRFKAGDRTAFSMIYESHVDALYNYGKNFCQDHDLILDSIQDLFVEIWNRKEFLGDTGNIRYYLLKSLRRKIFASQKDSRRWYFDWIKAPFNWSDFYDKKAMDQFVDMEMDDSERKREMIVRAIDKLPLRQKEALFYVYYEELAYEEVASVMNVNIKTVYNFVWRAIETLRKNLKT